MNFRDKRAQLRAVILGVLQFISDFPEPANKVKKCISIGIAPEVTATMGFFDGATQGGVGGAGMIFYITKTHYFHLTI